MQKPDDEDGAQGSAELPPGAQIFLLSEGVTVTTALSLAAELGVADHLAEGSRRAYGSAPNVPHGFRSY